MGIEFRKYPSTSKKTPSKRDWVTCLPLNGKNSAANLWHAISSFRNFIQAHKCIRIIQLLSANEKTKPTMPTRVQNRKQREAKE